MTVAPHSLAICSDAVLTPPPAPTMRAVSPGINRPWVSNMRQAVRKVSCAAAVTAKSASSGITTTASSGTAMYSAKVPLRSSPRMQKPGLREGSPRRVNSSALVGKPGQMATRAPTSTLTTPSPRAATTPAPSAPPIWGIGNLRPGQPRRIQMSRWLRAAASSFTSTSPGPAWGSAVSSKRRTSGSPCS